MNYILDNLTAKQRRKNMQHIKNKDTLIELKLRKKLWSQKTNLDGSEMIDKEELL